MNPIPPKPATCHCCGDAKKLVQVSIRKRTFRLCDDCATKVVSDLQRELIPAMR